MVSKDKHLTTPEGEAPELSDDFFTKANRGRPVPPDTQKRVSLKLNLDPDVRAALKAVGGDVSAWINRLFAMGHAEGRGAKVSMPMGCGQRPDQRRQQRLCALVDGFGSRPS